MKDESLCGESDFVTKQKTGIVKVNVEKDAVSPCNCPSHPDSGPGLVRFYNEV